LIRNSKSQDRNAPAQRRAPLISNRPAGVETRLAGRGGIGATISSVMLWRWRRPPASALRLYAAPPGEQLEDQDDQRDHQQQVDE
jgi:hypothetical protein